MKRIYLFATMLLTLCVSGAQAQNLYTSIAFFAPDSSNGPVMVCTGTNLTVYTHTTTTGYSMGDAVQIAVDWGDGITQAYNSTIVQSNYYNPNAFSHVYATPGIYTATFAFSDTYLNMDEDTIVFSVGNNCGTIYTHVKLDTDNNGTGDISIPNALIDMVGNTTSSTVPLHPYGGAGQIGYIISGVDVTDSPYTLSVNAAWLAANGYIMSPSSPTSHTVTLTNVSPVDDTPPFIIACDPGNPVSQTDLAVSYMYGWGFRAGQQTGYLKVNVCNLSCSGNENADLDITFESLLTVYSHDIPGATVTGNVLHANLNVNGCTTYTIYFDVPGPTPAGTPLNFSATVTPTAATDFDLTNNTRTYLSEVRNSWDPNDKLVDKPEMVSPSVHDEFTYTIRFQNMGNDDAYNIVIKDTLDADLDLGTFLMLEHSHNVSVSIDPVTRIATFTFPNINLPAASINEPASHGSVTYRIKENAGLAVGTEITNTAYIYFDFNPPIITNTTYNINKTVNVEQVVADDLVAYPIPASDYLVVSSKQDQPISSIKLIDVTGKTVLNITNVGGVYTLDLQGIASGAYNLAIESQGAVVNKKIMINK